MKEKASQCPYGPMAKASKKAITWGIVCFPRLEQPQMQYFFGIYLQDQHLRCDLICLKVLENVSIFNNAIRLMKSLVSLVLSFAK